MTTYRKEDASISFIMSNLPTIEEGDKVYVDTSEGVLKVDTVYRYFSDSGRSLIGYIHSGYSREAVLTFIHDLITKIQNLLSRYDVFCLRKCYTFEYIRSSDSIHYHCMVNDIYHNMDKLLSLLKHLGHTYKSHIPTYEKFRCLVHTCETIYSKVKPMKIQPLYNMIGNQTL